LVRDQPRLDRRRLPLHDQRERAGQLPGRRRERYLGESALNSGTVHLDGWGGNQTFVFTDKSDASGCSFVFDNDWDSKGNTTVANDPSIWSGNGWLQPGTSGSRDWIFIGEMLTLPTRSVSWGTVKAMYR
jgi:hypothetical protein